jgi:uncharacterized membrane protein YphA (DoxX/SURF4 family)
MALTRSLTEIGRLLFAVSMMVFGVQDFLYTGYVRGLQMVPEWIPGHTFVAYLVGIILIAAGVCILLNRRGRLAAFVLGVFFFLCTLLIHIPRIGTIVHDVSERTVLFETLTLCGGAWILARSLPTEGFLLGAFDIATDKTFQAACVFVSVSMAVFGLGHLQVARFVAGLVPAWIQWHLFWVYFTAFGFFAAAVSIATKRFVRLVEGLLGLMFLLWFVVLHAPRVAVSIHNGDEWNSAFVALAMSGIAFIIAGALQQNGQSEMKLHPAESRGVSV